MVDFEKAYLTLRDAVAETMLTDEMLQFMDTKGCPEESRLELLQGYLVHIKAERATQLRDDTSNLLRALLGLKG